MAVNGHFVLVVANQKKIIPALLDLGLSGPFHQRQLRYVPCRSPESPSERAAWGAADVRVSYFNINF